MALNPRIDRLERRLAPANTPDGCPRCRVCREGALLASVARFDGYPAWGGQGQGAGTCAACGRVCREEVVVRGIDPALM